MVIVIRVEVDEVEVELLLLLVDVVGGGDKVDFDVENCKAAGLENKLEADLR